VTGLPLAVEADDAPEDADGRRACRSPRPSAAGWAGRTTATPIGSRRRKGRFTPSRSCPGASHRRPTRSCACSTPGEALVEVDDTFGKDPRLEWTAPADGAYVVRVGDLHGRGGEGFGYVLLAEPARPDFVLTCDPDKLNVGPGARTPVFVKVERRGGFKGPVTVECRACPTASPPAR
jgi:hypothetical protein